MNKLTVMCMLISSSLQISNSAVDKASRLIERQNKLAQTGVQMESGDLTILLVVVLVALCIGCIVTVACTFYKVFDKYEEGF